MLRLPYTRALHPDDRTDPDLAPHWAALDAFEGLLAGTFYRKDHHYRTWEYANCLRQLREIYGEQKVAIHDTGSGGSYFPPYLASQGYPVTVSDSMHYGDITPMLIEQCIRLNLRIPIMANPVEDLRDVASDSQNVTTCVSVIEHVEPASYEQALRELCRVTKPGGLIFITSDYFRDMAQADASPFRQIQHNCLTAARVEEIPTIIPAAFLGGVDLTYKGDFVNNYSFINICLQKL